MSAPITFGRYPQTASGTDRTPIEWLVLDESNNERLLLSKHILDCKRYHRSLVATSWRDCDLRAWLNDTFLQTAFTDAEQRALRDEVFLLDAATVETLDRNTRRARGTEYAKLAKPDGCRLYVMDKNVDADYIHEAGKTYGCSWWWLRDQGRLKNKGDDATRAVFVGTRASIRHYARVDLAGYGVRPALKLTEFRRGGASGP
jgi:hypothetical protein